MPETVKVQHVCMRHARRQQEPLSIGPKNDDDSCTEPKTIAAAGARPSYRERIAAAHAMRASCGSGLRPGGGQGGARGAPVSSSFGDFGEEGVLGLRVGGSFVSGFMIGSFGKLFLFFLGGGGRVFSMGWIDRCGGMVKVRDEHMHGPVRAGSSSGCPGSSKLRSSWSFSSLIELLSLSEISNPSEPFEPS